MPRRTTRRSTTASRRATARRPTRRKAAPLSPDHAREVFGMALAGAGVLSLASMVLVWAGRGAPLLVVADAALTGLFGAGWLLAVGGAVVAGGLLFSPNTPRVGRWRVLAWLAMFASAFALLRLAGWGGLVGLILAWVPLRVAGGIVTALFFSLLLLATVVLALRMSLGAALLHVLTTSRKAIGEGNRLTGAVPAFRATLTELLAAMREHAAPPQALAAEAAPTAAPVIAAQPEEEAGVALAVHAPLGEEEEEGPDAERTEDGEDDGGLTERPRVAGDWIREECRDWRLPTTTTLLEPLVPRRAGDLHAEVTGNRRTIEAKLGEFGVEAKVVDARSGPSVTLYEIKLRPGVTVRKFLSLQRDLASALAMDKVVVKDIVEGHPGIVGIEVPNKNPVLVPARGVLDAMLRAGGHILGVALGNDVAGRPVSGDLQRMPHLLIAGATGQGKSVCLNTLLCSLLFQLPPRLLRLVLVDPKRLELQQYNGLPHLAVPVIVEPYRATAALRWAVSEMERRYKVLAHGEVRNILAYNEKAAATGREPMPYVVIVIDELADLMMVAAGEIEELLCRIAQLARAAGIHLVVATQRPSTDIITGLIKANFPSRIAFAVADQVNSRVILDAGGAEKLLGRGDMLYQPVDAGKPTRLQGAFISDGEVESLVRFWAAQGEPRFIDEVLEGAVAPIPTGGDSDDDRRLDPIFARAARAVAAEGQASVSQVQRKFNVGYSRAGRIVDQLAEHRVVGSYQGSKSREVLMGLPEIDRLLEQLGVEG